MPRVGVDVVKEISGAIQATPASGSNLAGASTASPPATFKSACAVCHDDDVIRQQRLTRAQWDREIGKMTGWGAKVKDEDRAGVLDYLFSNFGPRPRGR